jgi:hypothetical protein
MLKTVQSRTNQIETLSSRKDKEFFGYVFNDTYNVEMNSSLGFYAKDVSEEKKRKERTTDQRAYSKQQGFKTVFLYTSHNLRALFLI